MSLLTKFDSFNIGTGAIGTTIPRSGYGFQPKFIFVWGSGRTNSVDTAGRLDAKYFMGMAISPTNRAAVGCQDDDTALTSATDRFQREDAIIGELSTAGAIVGLGDVQSFDADGVTFIIDAVFTTDLRVHVLAVGGTDITNVALVRYSDAASAISQDITTIGFTPDALINMGVMLAAFPSATVTHSIHLGMAAWNGSSWDQAVTGGRCRDASALMEASSYSKSGEFTFAHATAPASTLLVRGALTARLSNGFTINYAVADTGARQNFVLAVKGGSWKLDNGVTAANTTPFSRTGFSFQPKGGLIASHCKAECAAGTPASNFEFSVGAIDSAGVEGSQVSSQDDGNTASISNLTISFDSVYHNIDAVSTTGAIEGEMQHTSWNSGGVTFTMSDADPVAAFIPALFFGDTPTTPSRAIRNRSKHRTRMCH